MKMIRSISCLRSCCGVKSLSLAMAGLNSVWAWAMALVLGAASLAAWPEAEVILIAGRRGRPHLPRNTPIHTRCGPNKS